ncbi:hypothetical protein [Salirhabdus salicampi]|uniref:hypothetical protein n=1 Tax=Salirhabdus salicampi TaxID=476102 RepID=UPI0020C51C63|nr:hypothetical protein [Salirhabdus salicampi]MCP8616235.1 hypothetical protein [Salirhabdus salicampi]
MFSSLIAVWLIFIVTIVFINKTLIRTSTMAAVMAFGIVIYGIAGFGLNVELSTNVFWKYITFFIFTLWTLLISSYAYSLLSRNFHIIHFSNPINRFGIGTWIAGTSICTLLFHEQYAQYLTVSIAMVGFELVLWMVYVLFCIKSFLEIKRNGKQHVHGIILLSTVSTQSVVITLNTVVDDVPFTLNLAMIIVGLCFYFISVWYMVQRYMLYSWKIEKDWIVTNCILHGALSITGVACFLTGDVSHSVLLTIWIGTTIVFLLVETVEVTRLIKRIKIYGIKQGLFLYDQTHWSRIFTFGMYYTFTAYVIQISPFAHVQMNILKIGLPILLLLLGIEFVIFISHLVNKLQQKYKQADQINKKKTM